MIILILIGEPDYETNQTLTSGFSFFRLGDSQDDVLPKIGVLFFIPINSSFR